MSPIPPHPTSNSPLDTLESLITRWYTQRRNASFIRRLGMRCLEVIVLAAAMFIVPRLIHRGVHCFDEVYELLGRRARSPYAPSAPWASLAVAIVLLLGWHVWLGQLSYSAIVEEKDKKESIHTKEDDAKMERQQRRVSWGRVLGRIVIPLFLLSFAVHFTYQIVHRFSNPLPLITPNTNVAAEVEREVEGL